MSAEQRQLFEALPEAFEAADAEARGQAQTISRASVFRWLDHLVKTGLLTKKGRGRYKKTRETRETNETSETFPLNEPETAILGSARRETFDETRETMRLPPETKSQSLTGANCNADETIPQNGGKKGESLKVSRVSRGSGTFFVPGERVRVPQGVGAVVDGAADPVVVRVGTDEMEVPRAHVQPLE